MAEAKLNRKLNLVLTVETDKGVVHIHTTPISRAVFEENFLVISKAFSAIFVNEVGPMGPRIAALLLKQEAEKLGTWDKVQQSLVAEVYRLTIVIAPGPNGWETMPYNVAKQRGILDEDQAAEAENCIMYFICASSVQTRGELAKATDFLKILWSAQTTLLNSTEYTRSLPMSTQEENIGEKPQIAVNQ